MSSQSVDMYELRISLESVKQLSDQDRFSYYLLGHIFNELMSLQKLVGFSFPKHDDHRAARLRPEHAQAMLLFRLACGKIWEATQTIRQNKSVASMLQNLVLPKLANGRERLRALNQAVNDAPWLSPLRNGMGFHYPAFQDWASLVAPNDSWEDDYVYLGKQSGNTFYDASDTIAQAWMFSQYGLPKVADAVVPLLDQMIDLLRLVNTFLEDALFTLIGDVFLNHDGSPRHIGKVRSPQHDVVSIPFWTAMHPPTDTHSA